MTGRSDIRQVLKTGPRALSLIRHFETCKLKAYKCPAGKWTIGDGLTYYPRSFRDGRRVQPGDILTEAEAERCFKELLAQDFEPVVIKFLGAAPTTPAQFGALVSFAWNCGTDDDIDLIPEGLGDSTLLKHHLAGRYQQAADAFLSWVNGGGRRLPGLVRRRNAERSLYLGDFAGVEKYTMGAVKA